MAAPLIAIAGRTAVSGTLGLARSIAGFRQASAARNVTFRAQVRWFGDEVQRDIRLTMRKRLKIAAQLLRDRVVLNISRPVTKIRGRTGRVRVDPQSRSRPGEYPKLDTGRLRRDVFWEMRGDDRAIVGSSLDYALVHEVGDRPFLTRTLRETHPVLRRILTRPM